MSNRLKQASDIASVLGVVIAAIAVLIAGYQLRIVQGVAREARAISFRRSDVAPDRPLTFGVENLH
jgi:hypothetical protein